MTRYLLIESRDPFDSNDVGFLRSLATGLISDGHEVTLFLVQNAVLSLRSSEHSVKLKELASTGITILADDFSLRERAISNDISIAGAQPARLDVVIDELASGARMLWH